MDANRQARLATAHNDLEEVRGQLKEWHAAIRLVRRRVRIRQLLKQWLQVMVPGTTATRADKTKAARTLIDELMKGIADAAEPRKQLLKDVKDALPPERSEEALNLKALHLLQELEFAILPEPVGRRGKIRQLLLNWMDTHHPGEGFQYRGALDRVHPSARMAAIRRLLDELMNDVGRIARERSPHVGAAAQRLLDEWVQPILPVPAYTVELLSKVQSVLRSGKLPVVRVSPLLRVSALIHC